jgi:hypothetical protein
MRATIVGVLALIGAAIGCGDGGGDVTAGSGGGAQPAIIDAGGGGGGGASVCEVPESPLRLVFAMPDGHVVDSTMAVNLFNEASADVVGAASLLPSGEIEVKDEVSGDVGKVLIEGTSAPQVAAGQKVRLTLRVAPREGFGPDAYHVEIIDDGTDQILFVAVKGYIYAFEGTRVSVELGKRTCSSFDQENPNVSAGVGTGTGHEVYEVVVDAGGAGSVAVASGAMGTVETTGFALSVENQSASAIFMFPEGYFAVGVVGRVIYPPD